MPAHPANSGKTRILFFSEAVTLAHVARPVALAQGLDARDYDIHLAHHPRYRALLGELPFSEHHIESISPQQFFQALATGSPLYDLDTLRAYAEEDLRVIAAVQPDIIVGDFRLSLAVSAEISGIPYITVSNAYWSPYCRQRYTVPDLPLTRALGVTLGQAAFSMARPFAFALHTRPMARLRRAYGLDSLGLDLRRVYTHGDYTLYADVPGFYDMVELPAQHRFIGEVSWSPRCAYPDWWQDLPGDRPIVYVTLGSSGATSLLPEVCRALAAMEVTALVSSAGAPAPEGLADNVYMAPYLPGDEAVQMASLVICNGGSPGTHQALAQGVPVIGIAGNLDQYLNMAAVTRAGAGLGLRAGQCSAGALAQAVQAVMSDASFGEAAARAAAMFSDYDPVQALSAVLDEVVSADVRPAAVGQAPAQSRGAPP